MSDTNLDIKKRKDVLLAAVFTPSYTEKNITFKGYAKSVSSTNTEGAFDVLPEHENFVTVITNKVVIVDDSNKRVEIPLGKGLLEASNNEVKIYVEF